MFQRSRTPIKSTNSPPKDQNLEPFDFKKNFKKPF